MRFFINQIKDQAEIAIAEANAVLFLVEAESGVTPADHEVAQILRSHQRERDGEPYPPVFLVVNKADRPSVLRTVNALEMMLHLGQPVTSHHQLQLPGDKSSPIRAEPTPGAQWTVPVLQTIAIEGKGVEDLIEKVIEHRNYLVSSEEWFQRELQRSRREIERLLQNKIIAHTHSIEVINRS